MKIAFAGTPEVAVPSLEVLAASRHDVAGVITRPDAPSGRGKRLHASPVAERAAALGIPVLKPEHPRHPEFAQQLVDLGVEAVAVVAYGALIPERVLHLVDKGWINLHFSSLPRWRGAAPVQRAILAGDTTTGACTFDIVKALDAGPLRRSLTVPIGPDDTAGDLLARLAVVGAPLLVSTMDDVEAGVAPTPQPESGVTLAAKLTPADARIDWSQPSVVVSRQVRATTPAPGAWSLLDGQRLKVLRASVATDAPELEAGQLAAGRRDLWAGTADGALRLDQVQAFGKRAMTGADWARGVSISGGTRLI